MATLIVFTKKEFWVARNINVKEARAEMERRIKDGGPVVIMATNGVVTINGSDIVSYTINP